ncbi:hypothetical protein CHS0354_014061 [Potamilus streckersoni]|uniref:Uncharacterized protein n=1 Tax=Potamilus streckersoni TaxID=2493646 RepID=A0AAE0W1C5_9BIVA|nr:hypothetical protein CHS0354_014061 [Potamilus streckersoni]
MEVKLITLFCILMIVFVVGGRPSDDMRKQCIFLPKHRRCVPIVVRKEKSPYLGTCVFFPKHGRCVRVPKENIYDWFNKIKSCSEKELICVGEEICECHSERQHI